MAAGSGSSGEPSEAVTKLLRGSSLLLVGRVLALVADFAAHVLIVRYLTKEDFGAYTFALAIATLLAPTVVLGLPETIARYAPIFLERKQIGKLVGALGFAAAIVLGAGLLCVAIAVGFQDQIAELMGNDLSAKLLAILILIVPSDGLNFVFQALFASIGRVRSIFLRQYVLVPALRLAVAAALVIGGQGVVFLAVGYVLGSVMGLLWYGSLAAPAIRRQMRQRFSGLEVPARELMTFALPVFLTNIFWTLLISFSTIMLGVLSTTSEVADYQAVLPPARLNYLAMAIFFILFIPTVSRLYAREEWGELRETYLTTTHWQVAITVPILALTTVFAGTFVPTVFGSEYDASVSVLAMMAGGYYLHTAAGPASTTLKVFRRLRYTVVIDLTALTLGMVLNLVLIPTAGAQGAALAFLLAIIIRSVPYQWALHRIAGVKLWTRDYIQLQGLIALMLGFLLLIQILLEPPLLVALVLSGAAGAVVVIVARDMLQIEQAFPELATGRLGALIRLTEGRLPGRRRNSD